jgi:putative redox protein
MMETTVQWIGHRSFVAETGSGHTVVMDGAPEAGGRNLAPRPMEMVLVGLGGCAAFDVVMILEKGRHAVRDCQVHIKADRADTDPKVFTHIHLHFTVVGKALKAEAVERAVQLSAEKYCSASAMLAKTATITHDINIVSD